MSLHGKACVITGGGRGIGRATAVRLCRTGANVLVAARTAADLEETVRLCSGSGGRCVARIADMSKPAKIAELIDQCRSEFGRLDVLINNAGVAPLAPVEQMSDSAFEQLIRVNIDAVFYACRAAWTAIKETQGTIVNISSMAADDPFPGFAAYGGTKAFVNTFSRALAGEGKPHGIKVFVVAPDAVDTPMLRGAFPDFPAERMLPADQVAGVIELLLDPRTQPASGEVIHVKK
jgi:3-oxoacyl-[acyl-carrier protein] reductase